MGCVDTAQDKNKKQSQDMRLFFLRYILK